MKNKHPARRILTAAALILALILTVSALAEGPLSTLYNSAVALLFDTSNAALNIEADFAYNGRHFKHLEGAYTQDGVDSLMEIAMKTPLSDGTSYESGYTVVCNDNTSYSVETFHPRIYSIRTNAASESILSTTRLRRTILRLGSALLSTAEGAMQDKIETTALENGTQYHIRLQSGDTPELLNAGGTLLAQLMAERYFGVNYNTEPRDLSALQIRYESSAEQAIYARLYGHPMPDNFFDILSAYSDPAWREVSQQYSAITDEIKQLRESLEAQYDHGVALVHADGSHTYYDSYDAYALEQGDLLVLYEDTSVSLSAYYEKETGEPLPPETVKAIFEMANSDLYFAYLKMKDQMDALYLEQLRQDGTAACIFVKKDGSTELIHDIYAFEKNLNETNDSVTRKLLHSLRSLELDDTDVTVTLDAQNRPTAASGSVRLIVVDHLGERNALDITFTLSAGDYGTSTVEAFDPEKYGVVSAQEYASINDMTPEERNRFLGLPASVTFNGAVYPLYDETAAD